MSDSQSLYSLMIINTTELRPTTHLTIKNTEAGCFYLFIWVSIKKKKNKTKNKTKKKEKYTQDSPFKGSKRLKKKTLAIVPFEFLVLCMHLPLSMHG